MFSLPKFFFKKYRKNRFKSLSYNFCYKTHTKGFYYIKAMENGFLTIKQMESARKVLSRFLKKKTRYWICINLNYSITQRVKNTRMGSGKGNFKQFVFKVKKGTILFEIEYYPLKYIKLLFKLINIKIPLNLKLCLDSRINIHSDFKYILLKY
jgi:large subunit ribosomal protein L16